MSQLNFSSIFLDMPFAHRGLHKKHKMENSMGAFDEAISKGYGIELDVNALNDGSPVVFHDNHLDRLTNKKGKLADHGIDDLHDIRLLNGDKIPLLEEVLDFVAGRVPILVEFKYQNGILEKPSSNLIDIAAEMINRYNGPLAIMSFNPVIVQSFQTLCPDFPRGLVTDDFFSPEWEFLDHIEKNCLCKLAFMKTINLDFISHNVKKMHSIQIHIAKRENLPILCWTVKSKAEENKAREIFHNITFEGYTPDF